MNLTGDSQCDDGQFDVLAVDDPHAVICTSMPQGDSRSPAVYMQLTGMAPIVFVVRPACSSSSEVDIYLSAINIYTTRKPFHILKAAEELTVDKFEIEIEMFSDCPCYFELTVTANVLMDMIEAFLTGGGNLSMIDQNIVQDTGLVCILARIWSEILVRDYD